VDARWTDVARVPSRSIAGFVAALLEDAGIRTRVVADDGGGVLPQLEAITGGVHVEVPADDLAMAQSLLADLEDLEPADRLDAPDPVVTWRALGIVLLALVLVLTVGGVFLG
jgi:hypothetical protein